MPDVGKRWLITLSWGMMYSLKCSASPDPIPIITSDWVTMKRIDKMTGRISNTNILTLFALSMFSNRWHQWQVPSGSEVKGILKMRHWRHWCSSLPFPSTEHALSILLFLPPSIFLFIIYCERDRAEVGQGLLPVRIWLPCIHCFILKTF